MFRMAERLLRALLEPNPNLRIKAKNAIVHPWVTRKMYDPIPLNYYQSLTRASVKKKLKQAMMVSIFLDYFTQVNTKEKNSIFILNDLYIKKIEEENNNKRTRFKKEREKSFEVIKPKKTTEINNEETSQSLVITPNKIKLTKDKNQDIISKPNKTPLKNYNNKYHHQKEFNESRTPVQLKSQVNQFIVKDSPSFLSLNTLTNRGIHKDSTQQTILRHNSNAIRPLRVRRNIDNTINSPSKASVILPKILSDPYINSTSFPQSLRDRSCNHHHIDLCISPLRNKKSLSRAKQENNNKITSMQSNNIDKDKESINNKTSKPFNDNVSQTLTHKKLINQFKPLYLPNINRQSLSKRRLVILSNNIIIEP